MTRNDLGGFDSRHLHNALACIRAGQGSFICSASGQDALCDTKLTQEVRANVHYSPAIGVDLEELRTARTPPGPVPPLGATCPLIDPVDHCGDLLTTFNLNGAATYSV